MTIRDSDAGLLDGSVPVGDASGATDGGGSALGDGSLVSMDASRPADASSDAKLDVLYPDGAVIPIAACSSRDDGIVTIANANISPDDPLTLSVTNDGASLGWIAYQNGEQRLSQMWIDVSDDSEMLSTAAPAGSASSAQVQPSLIATPSGFLTVWTDNLTGVYNLRARTTDAMGAALDAQPTILTTDTGADQNPVAALGKDGNVLVVWQTQAPGVLGRSMLLGTNGKPLAPATDVVSYDASVGRPALAKLADGYLLAWVDSAKRNVHLQTLDKKGAPVGASSVFDADGSAQGKVDLATTDTGGAIAWDVLVSGERAEVHFRTFDTSAVASGVEHILTGPPDTGLMPSMVPLRGGYALAYRSVVKNAYALRLALLDRFGGTIAAKTIAPIVDKTTPVALRVSPDGQNLFLGWIDNVQDTSAYQLQRTWIHCD